MTHQPTDITESFTGRMFPDLRGERTRRALQPIVAIWKKIDGETFNVEGGGFGRKLIWDNKPAAQQRADALRKSGWTARVFDEGHGRASVWVGPPRKVPGLPRYSAKATTYRPTFDWSGTADKSQKELGLDRKKSKASKDSHRRLPVPYPVRQKGSIRKALETAETWDEMRTREDATRFAQQAANERGETQYIWQLDGSWFFASSPYPLRAKIAVEPTKSP